VWLISDDIAWMHVGNDGRLYAINPEYGFFGVVVGINEKVTSNLMKTISKNTIFTNVALTKDLTPWWEGLGEYPEELLDWQGKPWKKGKPAAHPNSRFTTYLKQYPYISPYFEDPNGVPVSVILFGGRRSKTIPLVFETFSWEHGVLAGAMMRVETTAAAEGEVGRLRNDPMAMLPFCGYNMGDYFAHWLEMGERIKHKPRIFYVNWFRKNEKGKFIWPGFNENIRVLKWIWDRIKGKVGAEKTPIGYIPRKEDFDCEGLNLKDEDINELFKIDKNEWIKEFMEAKKFFEKFGDRFPKKLWDIFYEILENLK
jgi:phosphoenolpyruvate carboxykinase (GTP)